MNVAVQPEVAKPRRGRGPVKFAGITFDARTLGCSYGHLFRVLVGERKSAGLLARYRALKQQQQAGTSQKHPHTINA